MKIAICMSGQLRNWDIAKDNQKWFWETSGATQIDYFIHTWNYSGDRKGVSQEYEWRNVNKWEFNRIVKHYDAKKSIFDRKPQSYFYDNDHWLCLFYSLAQSIILKRQYEIDNNFEYDLVIKSRPDVAFDPKYHFSWEQLENNLLYTTHGGIMEHEFGMFNVNDCVFYSNSYTMDLVMQMYFYRLKVINENCKDTIFALPIGPGVLMQEYFRDYGITVQSIQPNIHTFIETILKLGCPEDLNLFHTKEFQKMEKHFRGWYTK